MNTSPPTQAPCARCSALVDPHTAMMSGDGPICSACEGKEGLGEAFERAAKYYSAGAISAASVSFCFNPLGVMSIIALALGVTGIVRLTVGSAARDYAEILGKRRYWHIGVCALAALLGALPVLIMAVQFVLVLALGRLR